MYLNAVSPLVYQASVKYVIITPTRAGWMYWTGNGISNDVRKAQRFAQSAEAGMIARQHFPPASYIIGQVSA